MSAPGSIEIDRSGPEPVISIDHPPGPFTVTQLRLYGEYLTTLAAEAAKPAPEPEVEALVAVFESTGARWLTYEEGIRVLARAVVAAGYGVRSAATRDEGAA